MNISIIGECHIIGKREQQTHNTTKLETRPVKVRDNSRNYQSQTTGRNLPMPKSNTPGHILETYNIPGNSPEQEAAAEYFIPRRLNSPTSQATQLPELGLTLTPNTGGEHSQEINNLSIPTLTSQAPGPSQKRSKSPSSPFFLDATTFSDGKPTFETSELNPEDVTARLEDLEVEINTLHADTEDKELLISKLQDSLVS
ncbi:hypothetical protein Tco_1257357 [Tanacetum coccineum]